MPRVSVDLSDDEMKGIKYLKNIKKMTGREVIRRALSVYGMIEDARKKKKKIRITIEDPNTGKEKELIIPD